MQDNGFWHRQGILMNSIKDILINNASKRVPTLRRLSLLKFGDGYPNLRRTFWILCAILYFVAGVAAAQGAEVSDLVMNSSQGHLLLSVKIRDVIAGEINVSVADEVSATIIFSIALYEVKPFWFDKKIAHHTATNTIKHHTEKNEYRLLRSWDNGRPLIVDSLNKARLLMAEVNNLKLTPLAGLEKGRSYQIRVQAVCQDENAYMFSPSGCFKTDWHTVDFTY
jgi:hypothetical protein